MNGPEGKVRKERKGRNQKLKMLYLAKIFSDETDDEHGLTIHEIISELEKYGVNAERKSIYRDFEVLTENFGRIYNYQIRKNCIPGWDLPCLSL